MDGSPLSLVTVSVRGTTLANQTDATGTYELKNVPSGDQVLRFSKSGFESAVVTEVRVLAGQTTTLNGNLRPEFYELEEYDVTAETFDEQTVQILEERKQSTTFSDAIGKEQITQLGAGDAGGVLAKVPGAAVADGKYAVVRGLADRYTFTTLNDMELPSADPDRKAFQLDLMPAKFIEKIDVKKTFTPDMSGGFAGGSINIVTKGFPDNFLFELRLDTAYNTQSSLRSDFAASDRSSTDWLGFDDGKRALPAAASDSNPTGSGPFPPAVDDAVKHSFGSSQFAPVGIRSPLDSGLSLLLGDSGDFLGMKAGYLAGFNYKNNYRFYDDGVVRSYDQGGRVVQIDKIDKLGLIDYQWGALANLGLELNPYHELKFNFMYIQSAEDEARQLEGLNGDTASIENGQVDHQDILRWTERNLTYFQLAGRHELPDVENLRFDWGGALSTTTQDDPDYRIFQYIEDPSVHTYNANVGSAAPGFPTRYWRELEEHNANVRGDLTLPLPSYNTRTNSLKTGVAYSESHRDYSQRGFSFRTPNPRAHPFYTTGDPNIYLSDENLQYIQTRNFPVNLTYEGEQTISAGYLMGDWAALEWLEWIGGARYEATDISIRSFDVTRNLPNPSGSIQQGDLLPSLTAIVKLRENLDLRAAWSQTVIRPTYREIANVPIYDVTQYRSYTGNPNLEVSSSDNYDFRASWYPRPGEILSASVFAKHIAQPIEQTSIDLPNTQISYQNFSRAEVLGVEGEVRLKLDRLSNWLEPFTIGMNGAYIQSDVPLTQSQKNNRANYGDFSASRPLYNQPSYILNGDLTWDNPDTGTTVTLSGGMVGESLILVGLAKPDEFVQPAPELNLFIRQRLAKHWDVRFTAKNLLNPSYEVTQTWPAAGEVVLRSYTKGVTLGISVGCEF